MRFAVVLIVAALFGTGLLAQAPKPIDFAHDIVPILKARCASATPTASTRAACRSTPGRCC